MGKTKKSLHARGTELSDSMIQLKVLNKLPEDVPALSLFGDKLKEHGLFPLRPVELETLQLNLGYMCNQTCSHCHVDAGPDRKEIMHRETMQELLDLIDRYSFKVVDLTGGAPELNPDFKWFVGELHARDLKIMVRCNLTIILANKKYYDLPEFYKAHEVEVISSLPYFSKNRTDAQRGDGVFARSIEALKMLNSTGYGKEGTGLILNLVYNPSGAFLPGNQSELEQIFKKKLKHKFDIEFNELYAITNLPISRFLDFLLTTGNYREYMEKLVAAFNPQAANGVMCRNTLSISWDGTIYDCDFNQMLDLKVACDTSDHIRNFDYKKLMSRHIVVNQHCYGCTAGAGSSCGGELTKEQ